MKIHTIKKGETLWQIAQTNQLTLDQLMEANPQITNPNQIYIGDKIFIPEKETRPQPPAQCPPGCRPVRPQPRAEQASASYDDYASYADYEAASDYAAMPVSSNNYTYEKPAETTQTYYTDKYRYRCRCHEYDKPDMDFWEKPQSKPYVYTIKKGDTLYKIAKENGFTVEQLLKVNPQLTEDKIIYPGDKVFIPSRDIIAQIPMPLTTEEQLDFLDFMETDDYYFVCPHCGYKMKR